MWRAVENQQFLFDDFSSDFMKPPFIEDFPIVMSRGCLQWKRVSIFPEGCFKTCQVVVYITVHCIWKNKNNGGDDSGDDDDDEDDDDDDVGK